MYVRHIFPFAGGYSQEKVGNSTKGACISFNDRVEGLKEIKVCVCGYFSINISYSECLFGFIVVFAIQ